MADTKNGPELHPVTEELASGKNFAAVTTGSWAPVNGGLIML